MFILLIGSWYIYIFITLHLTTLFLYTFVLMSCTVDQLLTYWNMFIYSRPACKWMSVQATDIATIQTVLLTSLSAIGRLRREMDPSSWRNGLRRLKGSESFLTLVRGVGDHAHRSQTPSPLADSESVQTHVP